MAKGCAGQPERSLIVGHFWLVLTRLRFFALVFDTESYKWSHFFSSWSLFLSFLHFTVKTFLFITLKQLLPLLFLSSSLFPLATHCSTHSHFSSPYLFPFLSFPHSSACLALSGHSSSRPAHYSAHEGVRVNKEAHLEDVKVPPVVQLAYRPPVGEKKTCMNSNP